jgi:hypothetical protein
MTHLRALTCCALLTTTTGCGIADALAGPDNPRAPLCLDEDGLDAEVNVYCNANSTDDDFCLYGFYAYDAVGPNPSLFDITTDIDQVPTGERARLQLSIEKKITPTDYLTGWVSMKQLNCNHGGCEKEKVGEFAFFNIADDCDY